MNVTSGLAQMRNTPRLDWFSSIRARTRSQQNECLTLLFSLSAESVAAGGSLDDHWMMLIMLICDIASYYAERLQTPTHYYLVQSNTHTHTYSPGATSKRPSFFSTVLISSLALDLRQTNSSHSSPAVLQISFFYSEQTHCRPDVHL